MPQFYFVGFLVIRLLLLFRESAPLQAQLNTDLCIVGTWVGFGHSSPVDPGPHHEGIHGTLHTATFGLAERSVWHPCATRQGDIITFQGIQQVTLSITPRGYWQQHHQSYGTDETQCTFGEQFLQHPPLPSAESLHKESSDLTFLMYNKKKIKNKKYINK